MIVMRKGLPVARGGGLTTVFGTAGPTIDLDGGSLSLRLAGVGRDGRLRTVAGVTPVARRNEVTYVRDGVREWYRNGPLGLEQGFTLAGRPAGAGRLTISVGTAGLQAPRLRGARVVFGGVGGRVAASYGGLTAVDATGRSLPVRLGLAGRTILLHVEDKGARYPLTVDPFVQQGGKLTGEGEVGNGQFGDSIALSSDGKTAVVGAPNDSQGVGAVWVFVREGSSWALHARLRGDPSVGQEHFGSTVALSADGTTALIGSPDDNYGSARVFVRTGPMWSKQGLKYQAPQNMKLTGTDQIGKRGFGSSVALSADGNTALVGGPADDAKRGGAWVFSRSGPLWYRQSDKLTGGGARGDEEVGAAQFGHSVALSADGRTALIGGLNDDGGKGAAWVFARLDASWVRQGSKLTGGGEAGNGYFGSSVALSADGNRALVGGYADGGDRGAAWTFTRSGTSWSQQGGKLTGCGESGNGLFGTSAALSADGTRALIGGPGDNDGKGAAWVFARSGSSWAQQGSKLVGSGGSGASFGAAVALSGDGKTALVGGPYADGLKGAAWAFTDAPPAGQTGPPAAPPATTPTPVAGSTLVVRVVYVRVVGHAAQRSLRVRLRVSLPAKAQLRLVLGGGSSLQKSFAVKGGTNNLKAMLPSSFGKGRAQLRITLKDAAGHRKTSLSTVLVPT